MIIIRAGRLTERERDAEMNSWSNWIELTKENVRDVPKSASGVYAIRRKGNVKPSDSDIIYIGCSGTGNQGVGQRLLNLLRGLQEGDDTVARKCHSASPEIRKYGEYRKYGLEFSWIECPKAPDGVEKALLLAFSVSNGSLPICNKKF